MLFLDLLIGYPNQNNVYNPNQSHLLKKTNYPLLNALVYNMFDFYKSTFKQVLSLFAIDFDKIL